MNYKVQKICAFIVSACNITQVVVYMLQIAFIVRKLDLHIGIRDGALFLDHVQLSLLWYVGLIVIIISLSMCAIMLTWSIQLFLMKRVPLLVMTIFGLLLPPFGMANALFAIFLIWKKAQKFDVEKIIST